VSRVETTPGRAEEAEVLAAVRAGDEAAFATLAERYLRFHGESEYRLMGLNVLRIEGGEIVAIDSFTPELISAFGLPPTL
jgi:hypothetical protein